MDRIERPPLEPCDPRRPLEDVVRRCDEIEHAEHPAGVDDGVAPARILAARSTSTTASSLVNTAAPIRSMDD